nr:rifin PIR protein, putative [Plasmodium sp. DRC-Itaito]
MKLHCYKILLFALPLNILVTLYQVYNNNEPYITPHHKATTTSREHFDRQTSQRFEEYKERLKEKRQKRKEERDKNIQKIIEKDKMEKSLTEKVEKGCLMCGCGLGGVAASVGVFGGLGVYGSKTAAWAATAAAAKAAGIKAGLEEGLKRVIAIAGMSLEGQEDKIPTVGILQPWTTGIAGDNLTLYDIFKCISRNLKGQFNTNIHENFILALDTMAKTTPTEFNKTYGTPAKAVADAVTKGKADAISAAHAEYAHLYSAIGYSVLAILIIVLVLIIIYLVLRYRRKKKMKKKDQYTKLLNQ